jgi:hypothetical protein
MQPADLRQGTIVSALWHRPESEQPAQSNGHLVYEVRLDRQED